VRTWVDVLKALGTECPGAVDLGIRLLPSRAIAQPGDGLKVRSAAFALPAGLESGVHIGVQGSRRSLRQHSDDRVGLASQQDDPPKDAPVRAEEIAPQAVA
jgi:hypothetical protein